MKPPADKAAVVKSVDFRMSQWQVRVYWCGVQQTAL